METTPTTARLGGVIEANKGLLARARELNRRAGTSVFTVMDRTTLTAWLVERLQGARRAAEVQNPDALRLPELDQNEVTRVLAQCPVTITVLGADLPVEYRDGQYPRVTLGREQIDSHVWQELPDAGVKLPGGRPVEVVVSFGYYTTFAEADIPRLKAKIRGHLNEAVWSKWTQPPIALPDMSDVVATIPEIREEIYGACVVTGVDLVAYGVVRYNSGRYYTSDPYFKGEWTRDRAEAEQRRAEAMAKLDEIRKEIRERGAVEAAKADAEATKGELRSLQSREGWYDLEYDLRQTVEGRTGYYSSVPSDLEGIQVWITETRAIKAKVEEALATVAERKAQVERERLEAEEAERRHLRALLDYEGVDDNLDYAQRIDAFVNDAIEMRGAREAARILASERDCDYGRDRRANAIQDHFHGIDTQGLDWKAGAAIVPVALWAQRKSEGTQAQDKPAAFAIKSTTTAPARSAQSGGFTLADLQAKFGGRR